MSKKIKPVFPKYMYLSKQPTVTLLIVSLIFISLPLLALKLEFVQGTNGTDKWLLFQPLLQLEEAV